jgi:(heptosyl)LPS beta-1,4-glucosyltransferase
LNSNSKISVVINTLNEEINLPNALESVKTWADEIIVIDMESEDRTVEIAKSYKAKVYSHERMGYADPARAFAVSKVTHGWIFMLDADEMVPYPLSVELRKVASEDTYDIVNIPWINYFFGKELMYAGWGPDQDKHMRFFRNGSLSIVGDIHNFLKPMPGTRILDLDYRPGFGVVHFNYTDITQFIDKLNRYTTLEANQHILNGKSFSYSYAILKTGTAFFRRYIKDQGYKDGWRGLYLSMLWSFYRLSTFAKVKEITVNGIDPRANVIKYYKSEAAELLNEYSANENSVHS